MTGLEPVLLALADQIHANAAEMLDDLITAVARGVARHEVEGYAPGEAFDVAELASAIRSVCREQPGGGLGALSVMLALAVYRLATDEQDGRPVETRHPTGGVL